MKILLKGIKRPRSGYEPAWMKDADLTYDQEFDVVGFELPREDAVKAGWCGYQDQDKPGDVVEHNPRGSCTDWTVTKPKPEKPDPFHTEEVRKWEAKPYADINIEPYVPGDGKFTAKINTIIYFVNVLMGLYGDYVAGQVRKP